MASQTIIHYDSKTCPYAQRSWIGLIEKGLSFEIHEVDLSNKSQEFQDLYRSISPDPNASAKVPILIDGDTKLIESQIILEYLATKYRSIGQDLIPEDPADLAKAKIFIETFTSAITGAFMPLLRADNQEAVAAGREKLVAGLHVVDSALRKLGKEEGGDYFLGEHFTIADASTLTFLQRLLVAGPAFRDIDVWGIIKDEKLERLEKWANAVLDRPSAKQTKPDDDVIVNSWKKFVVEVK